MVSEFSNRLSKWKFEQTKLNKLKFSLCKMEVVLESGSSFQRGDVQSVLDRLHLKDHQSGGAHSSHCVTWHQGTEHLSSTEAGAAAFREQRWNGHSYPCSDNLQIRHLQCTGYETAFVGCLKIAVSSEYSC